MLLALLNRQLSVTVPTSGGSLTEGEIGPARFINPVLAVSQPDTDIAALVYSGLMRAQPDGTYTPDLASGYTVSGDGTIYTFKIRGGATFHDGTPVTARDVVFTIQATQRSDLKSTHQADWIGVKVSATDDHTVVFVLPRAYGPFIENTTIGILPAHIWQGVPAQDFAFSKINEHPVGSGPYKITRVDTDNNGVITRYELSAFNGFTYGAPKLSRISFVFFASQADQEQAYASGAIDAIAGIEPSHIQALASQRHDSGLVQAPLPRVFGVFFNQSRAPSLADVSVREALEAAIDKNALIYEVLKGYGAAIDSPIPPNALGITIPTTTSPSVTPSTISSTTDKIDHANTAKNILEGAGWRYSDTDNVWSKKQQKSTVRLTFTLATADEPELIATAHKIAADWNAVGINVQVHVYSLSDFNLSVLRPRAYDAALFGEVVGRQIDLFPFWHSSQRNDPGLNLSMYTNVRADSLLTQARALFEGPERDALYRQFEAMLKKDKPAVFLYSPSFLYIMPQTVQGVAIGSLTNASERFLNVYQWYMQTENVWSAFAQ